MAALQQILEKLTTIEEKIGDLSEWKAAMDERCAAHRQQTDELRAVLFNNNPNPGIKTKVETLWNYKRDITRWRGFWMGILGPAITAGIIGLGVWLLMIYKGH